MERKISKIQQKQLVGLNLKMDLKKDKTGLLWQDFLPRIKDITKIASVKKYSLQIYPEDYFLQFNPLTEFTKWAAVEVKDTYEIPLGMEILRLDKGLYAVFHYVGSSAEKSIFQYIYGEWLPNSKFQLDHRPHFEILGENYRNNDSKSEEDIYIPIK